MIAGSSAASSLLSGTACDGAMLLPTMVHPRRSTIALFVGAASGYLKIVAALSAQGGKPDQLMINATHLKAHRTAASLLKKGLFPRSIGRTRGGLNFKFQYRMRRQRHAVDHAAQRGTDERLQRRCLDARRLASRQSSARRLRLCTDWFRKALAERRHHRLHPVKEEPKGPYNT